VHGDTGAFAGGVEPFELGLPVDVSIDTAHVVVRARPDGDRLVDRVDEGEGHRQLTRPVQSLEDLLGAKVPEVEQNASVDPASLVDLRLLGP